VQLDEILQHLVCGDAAAVSRLTQQALAGGLAPAVVLNNGLIAGMDIIGERFRRNEIFVPEVLVAARAMKAGLEHLEPHLSACGFQPVGRCIIGTVSGDIHDIGKNLVIMMLRGAGLEVVDLGIDVSAERFLQAIDRHQPDIVAMSALLTTTMAQMRSNIDAFRSAGALLHAKTLVGGAPLTEKFAQAIGADAFGADAADAKEKALALLSALGKPGRLSGRDQARGMPQ